MPPLDPTPTIPGPEALGFALPAECEPGFAFNLRLLEQHWATLRQAQARIDAGEAQA